MEKKTFEKLALKNYLLNKEKDLNEKIIKNMLEQKNSEIEFKQLEVIKDIIAICESRNKY